jgi:hypothetical protein
MTPIDGTNFEHETTTITNMVRSLKLLNAMNVTIKAYQKLNLLEQAERLRIEVKALMVEGSK